MTLRMRNLTFNELLVVEETCTYMPHPTDPEKTVYKYVYNGLARLILNPENRPCLRML